MSVAFALMKCAIVQDVGTPFLRSTFDSRPDGSRLLVFAVEAQAPGALAEWIGPFSSVEQARAAEAVARGLLEGLLRQNNRIESRDYDDACRLIDHNLKRSSLGMALISHASRLA